jgi:GT2 family glycosyltransferase
VRRALLEELGGFDVGLGRKGTTLSGGEEIDVVRRIRRLGYKVIYTPASVVYHKIDSRLNERRIMEHAYWLGISEARIDRKNARTKFVLKMARAYAYAWMPARAVDARGGRISVDGMRKAIRRCYAAGYRRPGVGNPQG